MKPSLYTDKYTYSCLQSLRVLDPVQVEQTCAKIHRESGLEHSLLFSRARQLSLAHTVSVAMTAGSNSAYKSVFDIYLALAAAVYRIQRDCWLQLNTELRRKNITALALKGLVFLSGFYKQQTYYLMNDFDILVRPECLDIVRNTAAEVGFSQHIVSNNGVIQPVPDEVISEFEGRHYELFPFTRIVEAPDLDQFREFIEEYVKGHPFIIEDRRVYLAIEADIHHNLSHGFEIDDLWSKPEEFYCSNGEQALGMNRNVFGWFLPARYYHEVMVLAERKAKLLSDLSTLVVSGEMDYGEVLHYARKYTLETPLWYVYRFLRDNVSLDIPSEFLDSLYAESLVKEQYRDWGDFLPKLVGERVVFELARE